MPEGRPTFYPMPGKIVVRLSTEERVGSIIVPEQHQRSRCVGSIVAIGGDEADGDDYEIAVGDHILFSPAGGVRVEIGREKLLVLRTSEVLCRLDFPEGSSIHDVETGRSALEGT